MSTAEVASATASPVPCLGPVPSLPAEATEGWAETVWHHGAEPGARLRWLAPGLPVLRRARRLESLISPYVTCWGQREADAVLRSNARYHALTALPDEGVARLVRAYRNAGWGAEFYRAFGVWQEDLSGGWDAYWGRRSRRLRETVRRKRRRFGPPRSLAGAAAIEAQAHVAAAAWQAPEPFPRFVEKVIERGGREGWARTYALGSPDAPDAFQLWLVGDGWASLAKTWHKAEAASASPGTVLTAGVLHALAEDGVSGFDLGRGDDPYKADWAGQRVQRWGVLAAPLFGPRGAALALRAGAKRLVSRS